MNEREPASKTQRERKGRRRRKREEKARERESVQTEKKENETQTPDSFRFPFFSLFLPSCLISTSIKMSLREKVSRHLSQAECVSSRSV